MLGRIGCMSNKYPLIITFFYCLIISPLYTQQFDHLLTISELVDIALKNHPETKQAWWNAQRASAALGSTRSAYYPDVNLNTNVTNGRDFKFIRGPNTNYTIIGSDLALSFLLFDFGARKADVIAAEHALQAAHWETNWVIQKVMIVLLENVYAYFHAEEMLEGTLLSFQEAEKIFSTARELNKNGITPISDIYTSQANLLQMKMDVTQQKANLIIQKGKLATALGLGVEADFQLAPLDETPLFEKRETTRLISLAYQKRADLMAKRAHLNVSYAEAARSSSINKPRLTFGGRGGFDHAFHDHAGSGHYQLVLNLTIPLFDGFNSHYLKQQALANAALTDLELTQLEQEISLDIFTYCKTVDALQEMMNYAKENVLNAQKAFDGVMEKYQAGKEKISELSAAQGQLLDARLRYSDVKAQWLASLAQLAYTTGILNLETAAQGNLCD